MVKLYTAITREIDNPQEAVREIIDQLKPEQNMLKNTIGIVFFYCEFAEAGACQAIADALPFETVGCVSTYVGTCGQYDDVALSVTMITGDDITFTVKTVDNSGDKSHEQITDEIKQLCAGFSAAGKPKVVIPFMPMLQKFSGDDLVATVNALPETLPLFGTMAFNMENLAGPHYVLSGKKLYSDMFVFIAFYGDFEPKFRIVSSFDFEEGFGNIVEIKEAAGSILKNVNGVSALEYLKNQGILTSDNTVTGTGVWAVPAILMYPDGTRVVRAFLGIVEGTEYIYATGAMEAGAKIKFAYLDGEKTLASAEKLFQQISDAEENGIIAFSCAGRSWSLGVNYFEETQKIAECAEKYLLQNDAPLMYSVAYSGGEICPVTDNEGKLVNVLHNYTLVSCAFC
jgi:hypothetical protein